jgi:peptide/nickel transport system substrate-binding protein
MGTVRTLAAIAVAAIAVAVCLGGCGGSADGESEGGTLTGVYPSFPDHLDPGLSVTLEGWTAMQNTYIPLLTYAHADGRAGTRLIPGLAKGLPKISDSGRTYTLSLRPGLEYSDGSAVRASDFESTVERLYRTNSSGSIFYDDIVGAERFAKTKKGGISGIEADDRSGGIVIHLNEPRGTFTNELASPFVSLLPADTPASDQTRNPPPATGPYVITKSDPPHGWEYRRNPVWAEVNSEAMPDLPSGHVDAIKFTVVTNASTEVNEVEQGKTDWMKNPPPPDRFAEVKGKYLGTQFRLDPQISNYYFWMNTSRPPFDDVRVRRAVNYAVDPAALERIYAGSLKATQQILPPGMPGYRKFTLYPYDLAKAKRLVAAADPADRKVTVWTIDAPPSDEAGEYYEGVLRQIGFEPTLKVINPSNYFTVIGDPKTPDLDTGWSNWLLDYPHPNDYFEPQLAGASIQPANNTNWSQFDDPALDAKARRLSRQPLGPRQEDEYAQLDREFMVQAPWAPFGTLTLGTFVSSKVDLDQLIVSPIFGQDLTSFRLR